MAVNFSLRQVLARPRSASSLAPRPAVLSINSSVRTRRWASSYDHLHAELTARKLPLIYEDFTPTQSSRLAITLAPFITTHIPDIRGPPSVSRSLLPAAHHLVYANPVLPSDKLLHDGTDPLQSPGAPFVRRMWGGGELRTGPGYDSLRMDGGKCMLLEGIRDVTVKGKPGDEKVFVGIERRVAKLDELLKGGEAKGAESEESIRRVLWTDNGDDFGGAALVERRNIVFLRERSAEQLQALKDGTAVPQRVLKPQHTPDFSHTITPTANLLFRYSALTMNAHAIHLDPQYCRDVEGHRNLLFHGPMAFTFLVALLGRQTDKVKKLVSIEYRNLAPLYCWEPVKFCGKEVGANKYEVWAETPEGGVAVKGTAVTTSDEGAVGMPFS